VSRNGKYYGAFQLQRHHFVRYLGMEWEQVAGSYDLQYRAATGYVMERYGSWEAAAAHHRQKGWY
jgi:hypothetical protein